MKPPLLYLPPRSLSHASIQTTQISNNTTARDETAAERELVGGEFEDDGVLWRVLEVGWDAAVEQVVVWYYDIAATAATEEELKEDLDQDCIEHSSVREVEKWIEESMLFVDAPQ